jgi:hypothetical protein
MYNAGGPNAGHGHFPPPSHQLLPHQQQQLQQFYPNPYPQSAAPSPSYIQPQGFQGPANQGPRQQYLSNQSQGNGYGRTPLMPPPSTVPDDPFKKPHLPQQRISESQSQYMQNGRLFLPSIAVFNLRLNVSGNMSRSTDVFSHSSAQSPPFNPRYNQQQSASSASTSSNIAITAPGEATRSPASSLELPASSMTAPAVPAASTGQLTTPPESPLHAQVLSAQVNNISPQEQERVDALLNVNNLLLQEVQILQKAGLKAPAPATLSSPQAKPEGTTTTPTSTDPTEAANQIPSTSTTPTATTPATATPTAPSSNNPIQNQKKFVEYMGRLKTNIYYLVAINDQSKQKTRPPYPTHLESPPAWIAEGLKDEDKERFEALKEGYAKLRELWPDWKPQPRQQPQQSQQQQQQQQAQLQQALQEQRQQAQQQQMQQQQQTQQPSS